MAAAAVGQGLGQIGAAVPVRAAAGDGLEALLAGEERGPDSHQPALVEREGHCVRRRRQMHRCQAEEERLDRQGVRVGHMGVGIVGKGRIEPPTAPADPLVHGAQEVGVGPGADSGLHIRRDVAGIEGPESCGDRAPASERLAPRGGVTALAIGGSGQVTAPRDEVGPAQLSWDSRGRGAGIGLACGALGKGQGTRAARHPDDGAGGRRSGDHYQQQEDPQGLHA